jgi:hypothetical protein
MFADTDRHFRKLSIRKMQFQVTDIHFDFGDSFEPIITKEEMDEIVDETFSTIWEAVDEEDLVEEITAATGFCVNSINYQHVLK